MSGAILKYVASANPQRLIFNMPGEARILGAHAQHGDVVIYALVDQSKSVEPRTISLWHTGFNAPRGRHEFIGTVIDDDGDYVLHVFEEFDQ